MPPETQGAGEQHGCALRAPELHFRAWFGSKKVVPGAADFLQTAGELLRVGDGTVHRLLLLPPSGGGFEVVDQLEPGR